MRTLAEQEKANKEIKSLYYWSGVELRPKRCVECHYMPTEPEKHNCAATDKQVRMPEMVWDCPMGQYGI